MLWGQVRGIDSARMIETTMGPEHMTVPKNIAVDGGIQTIVVLAPLNTVTHSARV